MESSIKGVLTLQGYRRGTDQISGPPTQSFIDKSQLDQQLRELISEGRKFKNGLFSLNGDVETTLLSRGINEYDVHIKFIATNKVVDSKVISIVR